MTYKEVKLDKAGAKALQQGWNAAMTKPTKNTKTTTQKPAGGKKK